ncbi:hypothetical protein IKF33_00505 [Candidatus Saccharibacteria bacterium]|nr:hypothetical protein [Candidatus Saccharibacteria bacterium]
MFYDVIGWTGMILVLLAYFLLSTGKITNGKLYQSLNLLAALLMAIGLFPKNAWFSFVLQVIWGLVAIFALIKFTKAPKKGSKNVHKSAKRH